MWDTKLSWYSLSGTHLICFYGLNYSLGFHAFRPTWLYLIVEVLATWAKCCTPYIMDSPSSINTRQRRVRGCWPDPCVWCTSPVVGSHFGRPCCQLHGSVRCASSLEIPLVSGGRRPDFYSFRGVRFIAWRLTRPFKGKADGVRGIFRKCRARVGCGPAPGPTLKKALCRIPPVGGYGW